MSNSAAVRYHWIMTVQTARGQILTRDGGVDVVPGAHTEATTYSALFASMKEAMGGADVVVLFYRAVPEGIPAR